MAGSSVRAVTIASAALAVVLLGLCAPAACTEPPDEATDAPATTPSTAGLDDAERLDLGELFVRPVGPRGLEVSARARALAGRRVRVRGYVVRQDERAPGRFLLAPRPVQLHEHEYGLADDLPAATVLVIAERPDDVPADLPAALVVSGTLQVGNREEPDGRVSLVRLILDPKLRVPVPPPAGERAIRKGDPS